MDCDYIKPKAYLDFTQRIEGFQFFSVPFSDDLINKILNLRFVTIPAYERSPFEVAQHADIDTETAKAFVCELTKGLIELEIDKPLLMAINCYKFFAHSTNKGESIDLHNDARIAACGNPDILCWICDNTTFIGREFIFGDKDQLHSIQPRTGLVCLMDSINKSTLHGVNKLESNSQIITIVGSFDGR